MKALLAKLATTTPNSADIGLLIIRVWFGLVMAFAHGWGKMFGDSTKFVGFLDKQGFPAPEVMAVFAGLAEFVAAIFIAIGLLTRASAVPLIVTMLIAAFVVHGDHAWRKQEFPLMYAFAFLALLISGPGRYSVDHVLKQRMGDKDTPR